MFTKSARMDIMLRDAEDKYASLFHRFKQSADVASQTALRCLHQRLITLMHQPFLNELFLYQVFSLNDLDRAASINAATVIIDDYYRIADFYAKNRSSLLNVLREPYFESRMQGGNLAAWKELMDRPISYKNFNDSQTTTYVFSVLACVPNRIAVSDNIEVRRDAVAAMESSAASSVRSSPDRVERSDASDYVDVRPRL